MSKTLIIFGASGDLTRRKLIPALYSLHCKGRLPENTQIVGVSRRPYSSEEWRGMLSETTAEFNAKDFDTDKWSKFEKSVHYIPGDATKADDLANLSKSLDEFDGGTGERVYYLSTKPAIYAAIIENLGAAGLADQSAGKRRIVVEKPIGKNLDTAKQLNAKLHDVFHEDNVFRIDHYLGKETVQNLLVLRFANSIFEPIWNRNYIDHVQITVAESVDVGSRAGYYDGSGILRDMFQNHLLQLMTIVAMEPPARYDPKLVRDEKVKVLRSVRPMIESEFSTSSVRGQYTGYLDEKDVPDNSQTATFAALKLEVDSWRWQGVPFYLRSGKAMSCRTTQIVIEFRKPPFALFSESDDGVIEGNRLVIQVQPAEGIQMCLQSKVPDEGMTVQETPLDFRFAKHNVNKSMPDAYQRLLLDALNNDASLFARNDEVELAWQIIDPIINAWQGGSGPELMKYAKGDWGPEDCTKWMQNQNRHWFDVCPVLT